MLILVTGGAGYIGSHVCIELINEGYELLILDNLSNSSLDSINLIEEISGQSVSFIEGDIRDKNLLQSIFLNNNIDSVMHFAGLKAVGESVNKPLMYYDNNVIGTVILLEVMAKHGCKNIVFSSSATVYGDPQRVPINEKSNLSTTNPYGSSKLMIENILQDFYKSDESMSIGIVRYFNPVGAHESGIIGENPIGTPNNLMPFLSQVATGKKDKLYVYGNDYPTIDGTGVRDYIHVVDLAIGHIKALQIIQKENKLIIVNLGTGKGYSVLEMIAAYEKVIGKKIPYEIADRRPGDIAECFADPRLAEKVLDWKAEYDIDRMCLDEWRWQKKIGDFLD